jgi:glycosyltransferase involved in cell wall biosynthesis
MRILALQSGRFEHFLSAVKAVAARDPDSAFVGLVPEPYLASARATGLFEALHPLPAPLGRTASLPIWGSRFDACLIPFEDRLGVYYWTFRWVPIRHGIPRILSYDRRGWLREWSRRDWLLNTLAICLVIRAIHEPGLRAWNWLRPHLDVAALFGLAAAALLLSTPRAVGRMCGGGGDRAGGPTPRRLVLFIPSLGVGGAQRQLVSFIAHLDRNKWDLELVMLDMPDKFFEPEVRALDVPIRYLNPKGDFWKAGAVWRLAAHLREYPCHVLHSWLHYAAALGAIAGSLAGVPTIVGSLRSERPGRFPWFYPKWQRAIDILTAPLQTYLIANSHAVRDENRRWALIPRRKLITIYNGIDVARTHVPDRDRVQRLRRELGLPPGAPIVGIVGRLFPEKDHATFLRAARLVADARPDARFLIVGDGVLRDWVETEIKRLGLDGRVQVLGSRADALALIRLMDVYVLTSVSEGFPNVLLEAAVAGTPVVTTAAGGAAEVVVDGVTGFVVPCGNGGAVARRVLDLLDDQALRRRLADAARDRVMSRFSANRIAAAIEESYTRHAGEARGCRSNAEPRPVCFISPYAYGQLRPSSGLAVGGAEVQICRLAQAIAQDPRFVVTVLTGDGERSGRERIGSCEVVLSPLLGKYQVRPAGPGGRTPPRESTLAASLRRGLRRSPAGWLVDRWREAVAFGRWLRLLRVVPSDVVVMRCASPLVGYVQLACRLLGRRFVFQVAHEQDLNGEYARTRGLWGRRFEAGLRRADAVVCQHAEQVALLHARYGREGLLIRSLCPTPAETGPAPADRRIILWMARLDEWKQPEMFVELAARIPEHSFVMVGPASETDPVDLPALRSRTAALPNLKWLPGVPPEEAAGLFEQALLFVNTSRAEGFPNTFLQAAASGTPIVSWAVNPDLVLERYQLGYCADRDWTWFEDCVRLLCEDAGLRARLGENGRRYVREFHDPACIAGQHAELFLSLGHGEVKDKVEAKLEAKLEAQAEVQAEIC